MTPHTFPFSRSRQRPGLPKPPPMRQRLGMTTTVTVLALALAALVPARACAAPADRVKVRVHFDERPSARAIDALADRVGGVDVSYRYRHLPVVALEVPAARLAVLSGTPGVERVEEDRPFR